MTPKPRNRGGRAAARDAASIILSPKLLKQCPPQLVPQHQTQNPEPRTRHLVVQTAPWPSQKCITWVPQLLCNLISHVAFATPRPVEDLNNNNNNNSITVVPRADTARGLCVRPTMEPLVSIVYLAP